MVHLSFIRLGRPSWVIALALLAGGIGAGGAEAEEAAIASQPAYVVYTQGTASVRHPNGSVEPVAVGQVLRPGDHLTVGDGSLVEVSYDLTFEKVSRLDRSGEMALQRHDAAGTEVRLLKGRLLNAVEGLAAGASFTVKTPEAVASVRGTGYEVERFVPEAEPPSTEVAVFKDWVDTAALDAEGNAFGERLVEEGYRTVVEPNEPPQEAERVSEADRHEWDRFQQELSEHTGRPIGDQRSEEHDAGTGGPQTGGGGDTVASLPEPMQQMLANELGVDVGILAGMSRDQVDELMRSRFGEGAGHGEGQAPRDQEAMKERFEQEYERLSAIDPQAAEMMRQEFEAFERGDRSFTDGPEGAFGREGFERFGERSDGAESAHEGGEFSREAFERMMLEGGAGAGPGDHYGPGMEHEFSREEMERWVAEHPEFERFAREMFERYHEEFDRYRDEFRTEFDSNFPDANRPHHFHSDGSMHFDDNLEHRHIDGTVEFHDDSTSGGTGGGSGGSPPPPPPP